MYDGDSLDAVVCLVRDAAARGGRRAAVVGTCSYGGSSGATRRRARMHTAVFAVGPEPSAEWLEDIARTLPAPVRTPGMNTTRGWTLVLGRGDEGARGRDVAVQRVAADAFAAAVAAVNRRRRRTRPKYTPRVVIVESRLLPATRAVRAAVPDADVAVAVEDDLDRLVAASAAPDGARVRKRFGTRSVEAGRGPGNASMRRGPGNASMRRGRGRVVRLGSVPGLHRSDARVRASRVGVVRRVAAVGGDASRISSRRVPSRGARRRAQRLGRRRVLGRTGDRLRRVGDSTRGATGGGGGDGTRGGGGEEEEGRRRRRRTAATAATAAATTRTHPRTHPRRLSIFCASRGVRPACRRARLCSWTFASRPTTIRIPTSIRIRARKKTRPSVFRFPRRYLRVFRGTWRAVRRPARTRRSSGRYPRSMHSRRRAREP